MNWELLPVAEIRNWLKTEKDPKLFLNKVIGICKERYGTDLWENFNSLPFQEDINQLTSSLQQFLKTYPETRGIYFGLDTLNMNGGKGSNLEIGVSSSCDPNEFSDEWTYECDHYLQNYLIKGLYSVSKNFSSSEYPSDIASAAEYIIFLAYSGIIFREVLLNIPDLNFQSIWGFHDGDMFLLINSIEGKKTIISDQDF